MTRVKVYSRLTLDDEAIARELPGAEVAPPVKRGDVPRDIADGYHVLVLIDGRFHQQLAVACDEIMDAMRAGLAVFGASSMGALRAAELHPYGMRGFGAIFEWIRSTPTFPDDLLGQVFAEDGGRVVALSPPYVDLHFGLLELRQGGAIGERTFELVSQTAQALHYTERTPAGIRAALEMLGERDEEVLSAPRRAAALESQKRRDALGLLRVVREHLARVQALNERLNGAV